MCQLLPLIIFPTKFLTEDVVFGRTGFDLHWGWGLALGVFFMEVAAGIVFIVAPDTQEVHYSEKTVYTNGGIDGVIVLVSSLEAFYVARYVDHLMCMQDIHDV